jgi:outer membrane protein
MGSSFVSRALAVLLSLGLLVGVCRTAPAQAGGEARRIAVVNVSRVFKAYQKVRDVQTRLKDRFEAKRAELERERKDLSDAMDKFQRRQGSETMTHEMFLEGQKLQLRDFELKERFEELAKSIEKARMDEMKQVLKEIRAAIRELGQAERYDVILRAPEYDEQGNPEVVADEENPEQQAPKSAAELVRRFRENPVLYFATGVDITEQVSAKLNADYQKAGGTK